MLQELLNGSSRDPSTAARQAARTALSELPLTALSLTPLFTISDSSRDVDTPAHKTRRRSQAESSIKQAAEGLDLLELAGMLLLSYCPVPVSGYLYILNCQVRLEVMLGRLACPLACCCPCLYELL